jgi:predicted metal-dependent hydrolase
VFEVPGQRPGLAAQVFLKALARDRLAQCVARYTAALDVSHKALTLRDTRSRWGSCTSEGRLMFSWRLAMAEPDVLDYVAAHEVAHLVHMDHSPAFWAVVEKLRPDWREARDWLRREGPGLHAIRFDD